MSDRVGAWLEGLGLGEYGEAFVENRIDWDVLAVLTADDLKDIGVRAVGDRRKLLSALEKLGDVESGTPSPSPENFDASRRQVTVLFADISGYMALTHSLDVEDTHALLNRYFAAVDGVVEAYGGRIDKHIGDAVMAVFGAPVARTDDPERALRAALGIHRVVARLEPPITVHVGVASGQVVASATGSAGHGEYTVTDDSVNLASRLTDLAAGGETFAVGEMVSALGERFQGADLGLREIEGLAELVPVWRLDAIAETVGARQRFVGRARELALFCATFQGVAGSGEGAVFLLRGEAGIGKTHLLEEIATLGRHAGFACHRILTLDFGAGRGQAPVDALVLDLLGLTAGAPAGERARAVATAIEAGEVGPANRIHLRGQLETS